MKRDLSVITVEVRERLHTWVVHEGGDPTSCPLPDCNVCHAVFPKLPDTIIKKHGKIIDPCPCDYYNKNYVIRIAKEIIS